MWEHVSRTGQPGVDGQEHTGKGQVRLEGFKLLVNDGKFAGHPTVPEIPEYSILTAALSCEIVRGIVDT